MGVLGDEQDVLGVLREEGVRQTCQREQEEDGGGDEGHGGGLAGPLTEDAEPVGGQEQATEGVGPQERVDPQVLQRVGLGLQCGDLVFRRPASCAAVTAARASFTSGPMVEYEYHSPSTMLDSAAWSLMKLSA